MLKYIKEHIFSLIVRAKIIGIFLLPTVVLLCLILGFYLISTEEGGPLFSQPKYIKFFESKFYAAPILETFLFLCILCQFWTSFKLKDMRTVCLILSVIIALTNTVLSIYLFLFLYGE